MADTRSQNPSMTANPFLLPSGMTMDGSGRIVLVDPFRFRIAVVDPKTKDIAREPGSNGRPGRQAFYGDQGSADGFFNYPTGIAYDKTRDWFAVADTFNNRVQIVRIPGSGGGALAPVIGAFRLPMCVLCVPWILLLAAALVLASRRRRNRALGEDLADPGEPALSQRPEA